MPQLDVAGPCLQMADVVARRERERSRGTRYRCSGSDIVLYVFVVAACRRPDLDILSRVENGAAGGDLGAPDLVTQGDGGGQWMLEDRSLWWRARTQ